MYDIKYNYPLFLNAISKPEAYNSTKERIGERKERKPILGQMTLGGPPSCHDYLQIAPSLTSPTRVAPKKSSTASVCRPSDSRSRIDALLGLALACLTRKPKPFLLLKQPPFSSAHPPEASPTAAHSSRISFVHAVHSLKRCSLLCLPLLHHHARPSPPLPGKGRYHCVSA